MRTALLVVVAALTIGGAWIGREAPASLAQEATPQPPPAVIVSEVLGRAIPAPVEQPELALARVTIMPGAAIPSHYHPGTQIGVVVQGELTYSVFTGEVTWFHGNEPGGVPTLLSPGDTVTVLTGDALVESPGSIHQGANQGAVPLVIYLSTLFPADAPRSILTEATPAP